MGDVWYESYSDDTEYDTYEEEVEMGADWEDEEVMETPPFNQMIHQCLIPTFTDVTLPLLQLFISCASIRIVSRIAFIPNDAVHFISITTGLWLTHQFFKLSFLYLVVFTFAAYVLLKINDIWFQKYSGYWMAIFSIAYSIICELVIADEKHWHTVRGANMIIVMKVISLAFDLDNYMYPTLPPFLYFLSYCFSPCTVVFGPWVNYSDHMKMMSRNLVQKWWYVLKFLKSVFCCLLYLSMASCWAHWLFGSSNFSLPDLVFKWVVAYGDALSYRCSHYFVSYVSESTVQIFGFDNDIKVAHPLSVELPRSLVEVVIYWNFPMHFWLKTYVFKVVRTHSVFLAIFSTYAASSLLHGLNFQLAAVLLSLGFHTYAEYKFRQKISDIFSACVMARRCRSSCSHIYKGDHHWVIFANFFFSFVALLHLTYLGLMFDSNPSIEETGYEMKHTLSKWSELGFASHWIAIFTFVFHSIL